MSFMDNADEEQLEAAKPVFELVEAAMGFLPNSMKIMARRPDLLNGFLGLSAALLGPNTLISPPLKQLIAYAASLAAGCRYCQAHTSHGAEKAGVPREKIEQAWNYENSNLFTHAERAAMRFAQRAASVPNDVEQADFDALRTHYNEDEIVEIVGVISLFGFLNRWNDTFATTLEERPTAFAGAALAGSGWSADKHSE